MRRFLRVLSALCALSLIVSPVLMSGPLVQSAAANGKPPAPPEPPPDVPFPPFPPSGFPHDAAAAYRGACPKHAAKWCARTIAEFCYLENCAKKSQEEIAGASPRDYTRVLREGGDAAYQPPWDGIGFQAHHIVARKSALATFARAVLKVARVNLNSFDNLIGLRWLGRQKGQPGYYVLPPALQLRMYHGDTFTDYYYQAVNYVLAAWIHRYNEAPDASQVDALLNGIKLQLALGGRGYLAPGRVAHARDAA